MSAQITVHVAESERSVPEQTTAGELFVGDRSVLVARVNGELRDLAHVLADGDVVEPVTAREQDGLDVLRHSAAHVLAQAVQEVHPDAKLGIGPPIRDGFYYDFDVETPFTPEDLRALEKVMQRIVNEGQTFARREISDDDALVELADEPYKCELIGLKGGASESAAEGASVEVGGAQLTIYDNLRRDGTRAWGDLCRGPHVPSTKVLGNAFKLMRSAAAYWRGSEKNPQLQRVSGTAWPTKDEMKAHLDRLAEAEKRDHRKLGAELDLFSFPEEIGPGLAVFHPKGGIVRKVMEDYSRSRHEAAGYEFVNTPHITKSSLFEVSGHLDWYAEGMYPPMELDGGTDYYLKPMNCPFHILIYRNRTRSYRDLPLRFFEFGTVYRYEKSGVVHGLTRVRGMTQDDAHIFCTREQVVPELTRALEFVLSVLRDYGLLDFYLELSTKPEGKAVGTDDEWDVATEALRTVALDAGLELVMDEGGGAFYGPKISVQARDAIGRTWQMSTIQLDFQLPQRFDLLYVGADNERHRPIMIHRALFGTIERFFAILTEHFAGAFPVWLAPVQVTVLPVADRHEDYAFDLVRQLRERGVRVDTTDAHSDNLGTRIRRAKLDKVPYILVVGDDDVANGTVGVNQRGSERPDRDVPFGDFLAQVTDEIDRRVVVTPA